MNRPAIADAPSRVVTVAVVAPLRQLFDYQCGEGPRPPVGTRVWVPFGRSHRIGIVIAHAPPAAAANPRLKTIDAVLDDTPLLNTAMLNLARWSADYYHHPLGEVLAALLPTGLRRQRTMPQTLQETWRLSAAGQAALELGPTLGKRQQDLLARLQAARTVTALQLQELPYAWRPPMQRLLARGWVECEMTTHAPAPDAAPATHIVLNDEQRSAVALIESHADHFQAVVLNGVTGSGKTEVYLEAIARTLARGRQALVLVPEIALTQQLVQRFRARFGSRVALLHSALGERERMLTWDACRRGEASVLIGTRSAVWAGLPDPGLIVVDEEHDASYKQHDGFRYSARDVAIVRAQQLDIPVVLGSATPALETLANVERGRFVSVRLDARAQSASLPDIRCVDVRGLSLDGGLGEVLLGAMRQHLARGEQVMLFLNRRGYAPLLLCRSCGEPRRCTSCDAFLVLHKHGQVARCHHCDRQWSLQRPARCCADEDIAPLGHGTERVEEVVASYFPDHRVCRIDRDSVRRPGAFEAMLEDIAAHRVDILIGTQMVAKGLDFADITLVGIIDADSRLYSVDFRAEERLAQLIVQVAGRAGRASKPGTVLVQTHQPQHPVLRRIIDEGYEAYAAVALAERREVGLPPYAAMAIVRAESPQAARPLEFLTQVRRLLLAAAAPGVDISFPIPALMERRAGRYRALIVIRSPRRTDIGRLLGNALGDLERLARGARLRFSLDIDPQDTL